MTSMYNFLKENYLQSDQNSIMTHATLYHDEFTLSSNPLLLVKLERLLKFS